MGNLWALIQAHVDEYGVTPATIAKRIKSSPQTLSNWKLRGVRDVPETRLLRALAVEIRQPYLKVLTAALIDAERLDPDLDGDLPTYLKESR